MKQRVIKKKFLLLRLAFPIIIVTTLLALPRFAHHTPDSTHYITLSNYFQGNVSQETLRSPFAYRILVPLIASYGPSRNLDFNFAFINLLCTIASYFIFYFFLKTLFNSEAEVNVGMLLLIFSFPSFNYSSGVLTDPGGFLFFITAAYLLLKKHFLFFAFITSIGVLTRETVLVAVAAFIIYHMSTYFLKLSPKLNFFLLLSAIPSILVYIIVRISFSDLPEYFWYPSINIVISNISQPVSWATFLLTLSPLLILILIGTFSRKNSIRAEMKNRFSQHENLLLLSLTISCILLIVYSILTAFMSGRFVWPFYVTLIPLVLINIHDTRFFKNFLRPMADFIFGHRS